MQGDQNPQDEHTDHELLSRAAELDDKSAWAVVDSRYRPFIVANLRKQGLRESYLEDVTQDVFIRLCEWIKKIEGRRQGAFRKWLRKVAENTAKREMKNQSRKGRAEGGDDHQRSLEALADSASGMNNHVVVALDAAIVRVLLDEAVENGALKREVVETFWLYSFEDLSPKQIIERMGIASSTVHERVKDVVRFLGPQLGEVEENQPKEPNEGVADQ